MSSSRPQDTLVSPNHKDVVSAPQSRKDGMTQVTRERPQIDRIACPWPIRRFIEANAKFLYVPAEQAFAFAEQTGARPYDIPGAELFARRRTRLYQTAFG